MLRTSIIAIGLAYFFARSGFPSFALQTLIPPPLPTSYSSFPSSSAFPSSPPAIQSINLAPTPGIWAPLPLKYCEDATTWDVSGRGSNKLVVLSCDPGRKEWNTVMGPMKDAAPKGQLWVVDPSLDEPHAIPVGLKNFPGTISDFHPMGIEVFHHMGKGDILYVVNHQKDRSTVEVFELTIAKSKVMRVVAIYLTTLSHPSISTGAPNSIAVISPTQFYLSHDHHFSRRSTGFFNAWLNRVETLAALPLSKIDLITHSLPKAKTFSDISITAVASGLAFANGLALSHDHSTLAVASTTHRKILFYTIDPSSHSLTLKEKVSVPYYPDNLSVAPLEWNSDEFDTTTSFISAGHPHFFSLAAVAAGKSRGAKDTHPGSWVTLVSPRKTNVTEADDLGATFPTSARATQSGKWELRTLFQSDGNRIGEGEEKAFGS
ncbi:arylesterase / paraoxonase, partial [Phenoliferia sp. Uapishka_3]